MGSRARIIVAGLAAGVGALAALPSGSLARDEVPRTVVYATYDDEQGAKKAFDLLKKAEKEKVIDIESYAVISKDDKGKVHIKDQRKKGAGAGAVVGAVIGLLGGPVGVALGAGTGGAVGYLTGDAVGMPKETIEQIKTSLEPGQSAVIAVVEERWVQDVTEDLQIAQARQMLQHPLKAPPAAPAPPAPPPHKGYTAPQSPTGPQPKGGW